MTVSGSRRSPDQSLLAAPRGLSQLCYVLQRLWTPRHPPYALHSLNTILIVLPRSQPFTWLSKISSFRLPRSAGRHRQDVKGDLAPRCARAPTGTSDGGGDGTRTHDPLLAKQVLYQLSYAPILVAELLMSCRGSDGERRSMEPYPRRAVPALRARAASSIARQAGRPGWN